MVSTVKVDEYLLEIHQDECPINPREEFDNLSYFYCLHHRYDLGDSHTYEAQADLLKGLTRELISPEEILEFVFSGKAEGVILAENLKVDGYDVKSYYPSKGWEVWTYEDTAPIELIDVLLDEFSSDNYKEILKTKAILQPLYLMDHSGLSFSTKSFGCKWDSGQVGYAVVTFEDIKKEFGEVSERTMAKALKTIECEAEFYDDYLNGRCYGFQLYENLLEIESCWGFLGSLDVVRGEILLHLPKEIQQKLKEVSC